MKMKIEVTTLLLVLNKIISAVGKNDLITLKYAPDKKVLSFMAYDGSGLEMIQRIKAEGGEEEKTCIVKASTFLQAVKLYSGMMGDAKKKDITLNFEDKQITIKDKNGSFALPYAEKNPLLDYEEVTGDVYVVIEVSLEEMQKALAKVSPSIGNGDFQGVYFEAREKDGKESFRLYTSNSFVSSFGTLSVKKMQFRDEEQKDISKACFCVMPQIASIVSKLKGKTLTMAVSSKAVVLRDEEQTICVLILSKGKFAVDTLRSWDLVKKGEPFVSAIPAGCILTVDRNELEMVSELADLASAENIAANCKGMKWMLEKGEETFLICNTRSGESLNRKIKVECTGVEFTKPVFVGNHFLRMGLSNTSSDRVSLVVYNPVIFLYNSGSDQIQAAVGRRTD